MSLINNIMKDYNDLSPIEKWEKVGLLQGLEGELKEATASAFDECYDEMNNLERKYFINWQDRANCLTPEVILFPVIRRIFSGAKDYKKIDVKFLVKHATYFHNNYCIPIQYDILTKNIITEPIDFDAEFIATYCVFFLIITDNFKIAETINKNTIEFLILYSKYLSKDERYMEANKVLWVLNSLEK